MNETDPIFDTVPFAMFPYAIVPREFWQPYLLKVNSVARLVSVAFTSTEGGDKPLCQNIEVLKCVDTSSILPAVDPGKNDIMIPNNLIMQNGQIVNPDGTSYALDIEIAHIILELPEVPLTESILNVFEKLVADVGGGFTAAGLPALRFSDCSTVKTDAIARNQIVFGVAIQSFNPNLDGYTELDGYGIIVDDIIGVYMDQSTGILTLSIKDLSVDPVYLSLVTKIEITVYLKKAGWRNMPRVIKSNQLQGLLS
jgi:hypothetical protein